MYSSCTKFLLASLLLPATATYADAQVPQVDLSAKFGRLIVMKGPMDHYIVYDPKDVKSAVFYGDGKTFHQLLVSSRFRDYKKHKFSASFWSPRDRGGQLNARDGRFWIECGKRETNLKMLSNAMALKMVKSATFYERKWRRAAHWLGRDDRGRYYYVDKQSREAGGGDYRVYIGQRGNMKAQRMKNVVNDTVGQIFSTRRGKLRLVTGRTEDVWIRGRRRFKLTKVPLFNNLQLIYQGLGVYDGKPLGTPCDIY